MRWWASTLMPPRGPSSSPAALARPTSGRTPMAWRRQGGHGGAGWWRRRWESICCGRLAAAGAQPSQAPRRPPPTHPTHQDHQIGGVGLAALCPHHQALAACARLKARHAIAQVEGDALGAQMRVQRLYHFAVKGRHDLGGRAGGGVAISALT